MYGKKTNVFEFLSHNLFCKKKEEVIIFEIKSVRITTFWLNYFFNILEQKIIY